MLTTPVDRKQAPVGCRVGALPRRASSLSVQPSPFLRRVGVHIFTFEACSSFTRVTACQVAHPPCVGFIARLRPGRFPGSNARKLSSPTNNYSSGSSPHWQSAPLGRAEKSGLEAPWENHHKGTLISLHRAAFSGNIKPCSFSPRSGRGATLAGRGAVRLESRNGRVDEWPDADPEGAPGWASFPN